MNEFNEVKKNKIIKEKTTFDAKGEVENIIEFIRNYYQKYNLEGVVLGISGGKDSAVVAALFTKALGKDKVVGLTLPCESKDEDRSDAKLISDYYGFRLYNYDLTEIYHLIKKNLTTIGEFTNEETKEADINLKSRLRMCSVYYAARLISDIRKRTYLVAGTSNKSELYVGYFTKGGDSVHDIAVLADYTVDEVIQIGEYLGVPDVVLHKTPSDGLSGKSDEDKMGITYEEIANYMENPLKVKEEAGTKIKRMHEMSHHKFNIPTYRRQK